MGNPGHDKRAGRNVRSVPLCIALALVSCSREPLYTYERAVAFSNGLPGENREAVVAIVGATTGPFRHKGCATLGEGQPGAFGYKSKGGTSVSWRRTTNETGVLTCYSFVDDNERAMLVIKKRMAE